MRDHVRTTYRNHRKTTWALVLALAVAVAAVAIPLANGDAGKTYTLTISPATTCGSTSDGVSSTVVTLTNTARTQSLGSAEIYFPPNTVASVSSPATLRSNTTSSASPGTRDIVALGNLNLSSGSSVAVTVRFKAGTFTATVTAVVKQSNDFNDSNGGANVFTLDPAQGSFPTLQLIPCPTISGRVYLDRNADSVYTTGTGAFDDSDLPKAWTVNLYRKNVGASSYPSTPFRTTTSSGSTGEYGFSVPSGSDYKVCVAAAGVDAASAWALQSPTGNTQCGALSGTSESTSAGALLANVTANAGGRDFVVVPITGILFGAGDTSTVGGYTVTGGTNSTKPDKRYVQETWVDSQGRANFRFAPVIPCAPPEDCSKRIYLLETLTADIDLAKLGGAQASIFYDDVPPYADAQLKPMPYCSVDPRQSGGALATTGVLPGSNTSCVVSGSQTVVAGGKVHVVYTVYTAYDGAREVT